jgi:hypothetical protein
MAAVLLPGCGPAVSTEDLGTVIYEVPKVPGAEKQWVPPETDGPQEHSHDHESSLEETFNSPAGPSK